MKLYAYILTSAIALILLLFAWKVFPLPGGDSIVFLVPAYWVSRGSGLINPLYFFGKYTNPPGQYSFNYYVPFFPWFVGHLARFSPGVPALFRFCWLFGVGSLILFTGRISRLLQQADGKLLKLLLLFSIPYSANYVQPCFGRPEILSALELLVLFFLYRQQGKMSSRLSRCAVAVMLAMLMLTQLAGFYFAFLLILIETLLSNEFFEQRMTELGWSVSGALFLTWVFLFFDGVGIRDTLYGTYVHLQFALHRTDRDVFLYVYYWLLSPLNSGFIFLLAAAGFYYLRYIFNALKGVPPARKAVVSLCLFLVIFGLVRFVAYVPATIYNATQFVFVLVLWTLESVAADNTSKHLRLIGLALFVYGTLVFLWETRLLVDYARDGRDYATVSKIVDQLVATHPGIRVSPGLWSLCDVKRSVHILDSASVPTPGFYLIQEGFAGWHPLAGLHSEVLLNTRVAHSAKIMGLPLSHPQGFTYVLYEVK